MQIQIMFLLVCLSCEMSREEEFFSNQTQVSEKKMDYIDAKEYILALRKLLPELENTRNKTQTCKLVVLKLKINEKTDLEITRSLITKFKKIRSSQEDTSPNELALMLSCLEHFMNDFNNAHEFENLNGIEDIIFPTVVSTVPIIKAEAALLLASAALHSPKVQISALRSGVIAFLLKSIVLESDVIVQINSMLAVTSILKDYPQAQAKFVEVGGLRTLAQVVEKSYENDRVLIKIVALIHDLVEEHKKSMRLFTKKLLQTFDLYQAVGFEEAILNEGWCLRIARLLVAPGQSRQDGVTPPGQWKVQVRPKLDLVEKVCETLLALVDTCHHEFVNIQFKTLSTNLKNLFTSQKHLLKGTVKAKYSRITEMIGQLTSEMNKFTKKDEL